MSVPYYVAAVVVWVFLGIGGALPAQSPMNVNDTDGFFVAPGQQEYRKIPGQWIRGWQG